MDFSHLDMNTLITVSAFGLTLIVQIAAWAYYTGRFSKMIEILQNDFDKHKDENKIQHERLKMDIETLYKEKNNDHSEFKAKLAVHDETFKNLEKSLTSIQETNKDILNLMLEFKKTNKKG